MRLDNVEMSPVTVVFEDKKGGKTAVAAAPGEEELGLPTVVAEPTVEVGAAGVGEPELVANSSPL